MSEGESMRYEELKQRVLEVLDRLYIEVEHDAYGPQELRELLWDLTRRCDHGS